MVVKIRTSRKTQELFEILGNSEMLQPFALSKLAIAVSIKLGTPLSEKELKTDNNGLELNRQTITGEYDSVYKSLIEMFENKHLTDDDYVRTYLKAHIDRGAILLSNYHKYNGSFYVNLLNLHKTI